MRKIAGSIATATVLACVSWGAGAAAARHLKAHHARPVAGSLSEKIAGSSCYSGTGAGQGRIDCQRLAHLDGTNQLLFSPDGHFAYTTGASTQGPAVLIVLRRNAGTGALAYLACYGLAPGCTHAGLLFDDSLQSLALSSGATYLYAAGLHAKPGETQSGAPDIATFARNASTGLLSELPAPQGCMITTYGVGGDEDPETAPCEHSLTPMETPEAMIVLGNFLYTVQDTRAGNGGEVLSFATNGDGSLSQLPGSGGCLSTLGENAPTCAAWSLSPDTKTTGLDGEVLAAPDGQSLYLWTGLDAADPTIYVLNRDPGSGVVSPGGCAGESAPCEHASLGGLANEQALAVSPDSRFVYAQTSEQGTEAGEIVTLARTAGGLRESSCVGSAFRQLSPVRIQTGRISGCTPAPATLIGEGGLAMGAGGRVLYAATSPSPFTVSPVDALARNAASGALTPLPGSSFCIGANAVDAPEVNPLLNGCSQGLGLGEYPVLSPDGRELYTIGNPIAVLHPRG